MSPVTGMPQEYLVVMGSVPVISGSAPATIQAVHRLTTIAAPETGTDYNLVALDASQTVVDSVGISLGNAPPATPSSGTVTPFTALLPYSADIVELRLETPAGGLLDLRTASPTPPGIQLLGPNGGEDLGSSDVLVGWSGSDADGDPVTYALDFSCDGGATWKNLGLDLTETSTTIPAGAIAGTSEGLFRVTANDGFHSVADTSDATFTVDNRPPRVVITAPSSWLEVPFESAVLLRAHAFDREDGPIPGNSIEWFSDLSGYLGSGSRLEVAAGTLRPGPHEIWAVVADSASMAGGTSVNVYALPDFPAGRMRKSGPPLK